MSCRTVTAGTTAYRFCPDAPTSFANRLHSIVQWTAVDEITGLALEVDCSVSGAPEGLVFRAGRDGLMGLIGNPFRRYPMLAANSTNFSLSLAAPGFLPRPLLATLGPIPGFPDAFVPAELLTVPLHRSAIVVRGRTVQRALVPSPLGGALLRLEGVWSTPVPPDVDPTTVIEAPNLVSLWPGLYAERNAPADSMKQRGMVLAVGANKSLIAPAVIGDVTVRVSDCVGLSVGDVLAIAPGDPFHVEYLTVTAIAPAATPDQPAYVTLAFPLARDHESGTLAVRATPQPPGAANALNREGVRGDEVAFLASPPGVASGAVVEIGGGVAAPEYQTVSLYTTTSDPSGYYRLPPISRVAALQFRVQLGVMPVQHPVLSPDYQQHENQLDVVFP